MNNWFPVFFEVLKPIPDPQPAVAFVPTLPTEAATVLRVSDDFSIPLADYESDGERDAILGASGSGKSYLAGVLCEETLETGGVLVIIDPEGETHTLAECPRYKGRVVIVGGDYAMYPLEQKLIESQVVAAVNGVSTIFDLSHYVHDHAKQRWFTMIVNSLFDAQQRMGDNCYNLRLVVEECHIFIPQNMAELWRPKGKSLNTQDTPLEEMVEDGSSLVAAAKIAKRGRKRVLNVAWITQRPASMHKDMLGQCNRVWGGHLEMKLDYKAVAPFLSGDITFEQVKALKSGNFYFNGIPIKVRKRYAKHGGETKKGRRTMKAISKAEYDALMKKIDQGKTEITESE
jgi:DNA helicase HerA-like ATPase